jgi:hypothetical protein
MYYFFEDQSVTKEVIQNLEYIFGITDIMLNYIFTL